MAGGSPPTCSVPDSAASGKRTWWAPTGWRWSCSSSLDRQTTGGAGSSTSASRPAKSSRSSIASLGDLPWRALPDVLLRGPVRQRDRALLAQPRTHVGEPRVKARLVVVGLGRMGRLHAANLAGRVAGAELVGVVDAVSDVA